jgi:hypothetical protein
MSYVNKRTILHCKRCGADFHSNNGCPRECTQCHSRVWNKEPTGILKVKEIPLPQIDHSVPLSLKPGPHCPYESVYKSHTIIMCSDMGDIRYYCASCDACWNYLGDYIGVKIGIGAKR